MKPLPSVGFSQGLHTKTLHRTPGPGLSHLLTTGWSQHGWLTPCYQTFLKTDQTTPNRLGEKKNSLKKWIWLLSVEWVTTQCYKRKHQAWKPDTNRFVCESPCELLYRGDINVIRWWRLFDWYRFHLKSAGTPEWTHEQKTDTVTFPGSTLNTGQKPRAR